ncbi:large ribosomal subunit protein mL46 [Cloeon dipterum]|uniref:large ribosomal subunit protein mL46 n=1 Tax=Cloeon dipterum TaxID=197152 RepID=UPI00321FBE92
MALLKTSHFTRILLSGGRNAGFVRPSAINFTSNASEPHIAKKWDLVSSVCVERNPIITADLTDIENKMQIFLSKIELEQSKKSDHELRKERDKITVDALKKGNASEADLEQATKATAQDFEDASQDEFAKFTFASRKNDPIIDEDARNIKRHLSKHLVLLTQQKVGSDSVWLLPQSVRKEGETMRQTADRALVEAVGENFKSIVLGNAPVGFYKYKYPKDVRDKRGVEGAKVFFFKAIYQEGEASCKDFLWATKEELGEKTKQDYFKSVDQFLLF